ncbi:MAG: hypothetical protein QF473_15125, partial [Planctomycetota bacterium]|nr:hypothetical protein [Planctomycetota bacterium]
MSRKLRCRPRATTIQLPPGRRKFVLTPPYVAVAVAAILYGTFLSAETKSVVQSLPRLELRRVAEQGAAGAEMIGGPPGMKPVWVHEGLLLTQKDLYRAARQEDDDHHYVELRLLDSDPSRKLLRLARSSKGQRVAVLERGQLAAVATLAGITGKNRLRLAARVKQNAIHITSCFVRASGWGHLGGELWGHLNNSSKNKRYYGRRVGFSLDFYNAGARHLPMPKEYQRSGPRPSLRFGIDPVLVGPGGKSVEPLSRTRFQSSEMTWSIRPGDHVRWFGVDLGNWYALEKPGRYQLRVKFSRKPGGFAEGESNTIAFELVDDAAGSAGGIEVKIRPEGEFKLGGPMKIKYHI